MLTNYNQMRHSRFLSQKQRSKFDRDEICRIIREHYGFTLEGWQLNSMEPVLNGKDTIVTAPTGGGKTVTFQGLPFIVEEGIILVIEPTKSLISDQVNSSLIIPT